MDDNNVDTTDIKDVRTLLLGDENELITNTVKENARGLVTEVISEAMVDREQQDSSMSQTLLPLIEQAVKQSIEQNKNNFINYLYPIVGSLVRKSVSVFFNDFMERLNTLIEYSLTIKGIKWRIKAFQQGISFPQFIIQQTFLFRVEQVFFIHKETGLLLGNTALPQSEYNDPHLVSAMLSAINDFMADSFNSAQSDGLETIKTDQLTLIIQTGPQALLVTAISGDAPYKIREQLAQKIEYLHILYQDALANFTGDDKAFSHCANQLQDCLISELKTQNKAPAKKPIFAFIMLAAVMFSLFFWFVQQWQHNQTFNHLNRLASAPGIYLQNVHYSKGNFYLNLWRDPAALTSHQWLNRHQVTLDNLVITEQAFVSLEPDIVLAKAQQAINTFSLPVEASLERNILSLSGNLTQALPTALISQLLAIPGINQLETSKIFSPVPHKLSSKDTLLIARELLNKQLSALALLSIDFDIQSEILTAKSQSQLSIIAEKIRLIEQLSRQTFTPLGIIITGYSDNSGTVEKNKDLSQIRSEMVKSALIQLGVPESLLFAIGVGEVSIPAIASDTRKVIFSSILLNNSEKGTAL